MSEFPRLISYCGPYWDRGADYPHLELNYQIGMKPATTPGSKILWDTEVPDVHHAAVRIVRADLIARMLVLLAAARIPDATYPSHQKWTPKP